MMRLFIFFFMSVSTTFSSHANDAAAINHILDSLHQYAANADAERYFSLYADEAIFIGTDATETWRLDEFKRYAMPYFDKGQGWTYKSIDRELYFSDSNDVAWFVEMLESDSLGVTRGTGVLQKYGNKWLIEQYHLTLPIPNAMIDQVAEQIEQHSR
ncbi:nuclear transport factor 2 family protein [Alteromonas sp. H39]|uniref:nuclear transport factor 2 family protein n=1 Tax=Alteromonas sp. H39 TaxID=3389876 RepID=UPI0039DF4EC4